jgi:hypothetical protein
VRKNLKKVRTTSERILIFYKLFLGDQMYCYIVIITLDGQEFSNSNYAGAVTVFGQSVDFFKLDPQKKAAPFKERLLKL